MKKLFKISMAVIAIAMLASCGSSKPTAVESSTEKSRNLEGERVVVETTQLQGIEMIETLSEDGTKMLKMPYRWFAGIGEADNKQTAIEIAEHDARVNVSRSIETMVMATAEEGKLVNNKQVQDALTSHWKQVSSSILNGCEPVGAAKVEYHKNTNIYTATVKVGMRGDRFTQLLDKAASYKPSNLSGKDLDQFIETNQAIINTAKGN